MREAEQQSQNMMDSRFYHNFQNQISYSPFQEELIVQSIGDMIQTRNSVIRPISRLDSIMTELVNNYRNEETLSYQLLTNPNISNSIDLTQDSCCFENQDSYTPFLEHRLEEKSYLEKSIKILEESAL